MSESSSNQAKAPICAVFVAEMREAFGADEVKVIYVKEGEIELGSPTA